MNEPRFPLSWALAAALATAAAAAGAAAPVDLGDGTTGSFYGAEVTKIDRREFSDVYNFTLTAPAISFTLTELRTGDDVDIDWGDIAAIRLYRGFDASGPAFYTYGGPYAPALTVDVASLGVPSEFSLVVSGRAIGDGGTGDIVPPVLGAYHLRVAAQVPEPATVVLMFAGLGLLAAAGRRRRA